MSLQWRKGARCAIEKHTYFDEEEFLWRLEECLIWKEEGTVGCTPDKKDLNQLWNTLGGELSDWGPNQMAVRTDQAFAQT